MKFNKIKEPKSGEKISYNNGGTMNTWTFDSVKIYLTNPDGNEVILTSNDISDYTMDEIIDDINSYVNEKGGELE